MRCCAQLRQSAALVNKSAPGTVRARTIRGKGTTYLRELTKVENSNIVSIRVLFLLVST